MSISGINNYNYPNYYAGARHNMAKTGGRDSGVLSSTSSASSNITLHIDQRMEQCARYGFKHFIWKERFKGHEPADYIPV